MGLRHQVWPKHFKQLFLSLRAAAEVKHRHAARSQDKRRQFLRLTQPSFAQGKQRRYQNLLRKVVRRMFIAQMAQAVEAHARGHATEQLRLGFSVIPAADLHDQFGIRNFNQAHQHTFNV